MQRADTKRSRFFSRGVTIAVSAALLCASGPLHAEDAAPPSKTEAAEESGERVVLLNEQGASLYAAREYRQALERFLTAYSIDPDPNLLFNIASCHRNLGELQAANEKYAQFLRAPGTDTEGRERARAAIAELERERARAAEVQTPAPVRTRPKPQVGVADSWLDHPLVPWLAVGTGTVLLLAGASVYALGSSDHARLEDTPGLGQPQAVTALTRSQAHELLDSGNDKKALGVATLTLGAAVLSTYAIVLLVRELGAEPPAENRLTVVPANSGGTISFTGRF